MHRCCRSSLFAVSSLFGVSQKQGEISKNYTVPKEYITFRKPRVISEQKRERLIENLKKARGER